VHSFASSPALPAAANPDIVRELLTASTLHPALAFDIPNEHGETALTLAIK
jgi:hypothetical protein